MYAYNLILASIHGFVWLLIVDVRLKRSGITKDDSFRPTCHEPYICLYCPAAKHTAHGLVLIAPTNGGMARLS